MTKEIAEKKKRRLLKVIGVCFIAASVFILFVLWKNDYCTDKESDKIIHRIVARSLQINDPNKLTIADFEKVEDITLNLTEITSLRSLAKLKNIEKIRFIFLWGSMNYDIDFKPLAKLHNLRELQISIAETYSPKVPPNKFKWYDIILFFLRKAKQSIPHRKDIFDIGRLKSLKHIEILTIEYYEVCNFEALASFPKLVHLNLTRAKINNSDFLKKLTNLKYLELSNTDINDINPIQGLVNLEYLGLERADITDISPLTNLKNLQELDLRSTKVNGVNTLIKLTKLKTLNLRNVPLSEEQIDELQKALPNLKIEK
ncbi:MAG: hypothetical protein JW787_07260 [Sedimentisphaerales bacterium]|nr:hypothetical protein [Sedimentisphaerales bacterium]